MAGLRVRDSRVLALAMLAAFALVRVVTAMALGFGYDEAYTLANARALQLSYFDHPPLHQWIAHASMLVFGTGPTVRLPFIAMFAVTGWLMFQLTRHLFGDTAGLWALFALNVSAFFMLSVGSWVVPDGPLLMWLAAAACVLARLFFPEKAVAPSPWHTWLAAGLCIGLAGLSKYSALLFGLGVVAFAVTSPRHRSYLFHPAPYAGGVLALAVFAPVLIWNADNGWVSFYFQGARGASTGHLHPENVGRILVGEAAFLLPWIFVPLCIAIVKALRISLPSGPERFLAWLALPSIVFFTLVPLWAAHSLPHWSMPGWLLTFPLLGRWLANGEWKVANRRKWALGSAGALAMLLVVLVSHAATGWMRMLVPRLVTVGDPTLESLGWSKLGDVTALNPGAPDGPAFLVASKWFVAGKIDQALAGRLPVLVLSNDPRQFAFTHDEREFIGKDAMIIAFAKDAATAARRLAPYFDRIEAGQHLSLGRSGMDEIDLVLQRAIRLRSLYPLPYPRQAWPETAGGKTSTVQERPLLTFPSGPP